MTDSFVGLGIFGVSTLPFTSFSGTMWNYASYRKRRVLILFDTAVISQVQETWVGGFERGSRSERLARVSFAPAKIPPSRTLSDAHLIQLVQFPQCSSQRILNIPSWPPTKMSCSIRIQHSSSGAPKPRIACSSVLKRAQACPSVPGALRIRGRGLGH